MEFAHYRIIKAKSFYDFVLHRSSGKKVFGFQRRGVCIP